MVEWKNGYGMARGTLGNAIRQARLDMGLSQEALAELVDITPTHMKHIESEHRKPSVEVLFRFVQVLHFSVDSLFLTSSDEEKKRLLNRAALLLNQCDEKQIRVAIALMEALLREAE